MMFDNMWASWTAGIVGGLGLAWLTLRHILPLLLKRALGTLDGTLAAAKLKLLMGAYTNSDGIQVTQENGRNRFTGQQILASELKINAPNLTQDVFNRNIIYMNKAGDSGRTPESGIGRFLLFGLTALEGYGFSVNLAGFASLEGLTPDQSNYLAISIAVLLGLILPLIMHAAGENYYQHVITRRAIQGVDPSLWGVHKNIPLSTDQTQDDDELPAKQLCNRVMSNGLIAFKFALALVFILLVGITAMRISGVVNSANAEQRNTTITKALVQPPELTFSTQGANPFDGKGDAGQETQTTKAENNTNEEKLAFTKTLETVAAFVILGVLFAATQGYGIYRGYKYCFGGARSEEAYEQTFGLNAWDSYLALRENYLIRCDSLLANWKLKATPKTNLPIADRKLVEIYPELIK